MTTTEVNTNSMDYEYTDYQSWDGSQASGEPEYLLVTDNGNKSNPSIPGRAPRLPDHMLSADDLMRRNRRRARNREAANRQRDRRQAKVKTLEVEISALKTDGEQLREENSSLKAEIEQLKFQLQLKNTGNQQPVGQPMVAMSAQQPFATLSQPVMVNTMEQLTPTAFFVQTPVFATATNMATQQHFQFPGNKIERLSSSSLDYLKAL